MSASLKSKDLQSFLVCSVDLECSPLVKVLKALTLEDLVKSSDFIDFIYNTYRYGEGEIEEDSAKLSNFVKIFDSSLQEVDISHVEVYLGVLIRV